jgi:ribonuclease HI
MSTQLSIYTDGSHKNHKGSWAFVVVEGTSVIHEASGSAIHMNSNQMEFQAAIEALKHIPPGTKATIYSDSRIVVDTISIWVNEWKQLGWVKKKNRQIFYLDQIKLLDELNLAREITWKWIPAHRGQVHNERCDELCIKARA